MLLLLLLLLLDGSADSRTNQSCAICLPISSTLPHVISQVDTSPPVDNTSFLRGAADRLQFESQTSVIG